MWHSMLTSWPPGLTLRQPSRPSYRDPFGWTTSTLPAGHLLRRTAGIVARFPLGDPCQNRTGDAGYVEVSDRVRITATGRTSGRGPGTNPARRVVRDRRPSPIWSRQTGFAQLVDRPSHLVAVNQVDFARLANRLQHGQRQATSQMLAKFLEAAKQGLDIIQDRMV